MIVKSDFYSYYECKYGDEMLHVKLDYEVFETIYDSSFMKRVIIPESIINLIDDSIYFICMRPLDREGGIFDSYHFVECDILFEDSFSTYGNYIDSSCCIVACTRNKKLFSKLKLLN